MILPGGMRWQGVWVPSVHAQVDFFTIFFYLHFVNIHPFHMTEFWNQLINSSQFAVPCLSCNVPVRHDRGGHKGCVENFQELTKNSNSESWYSRPSTGHGEWHAPLYLHWQPAGFYTRHNISSVETMIMLVIPSDPNKLERKNISTFLELGSWSRRFACSCGQISTGATKGDLTPHPILDHLISVDWLLDWVIIGNLWRASLQ